MDNLYYNLYEVGSATVVTNVMVVLLDRDEKTTSRTSCNTLDLTSLSGGWLVLVQE